MAKFDKWTEANLDTLWEKHGRAMMMSGQMKGDSSRKSQVFNKNETGMSASRIKQREDKMKREFEKMLIERADDIINKRVFNLKTKKLEYIRNVCDPNAEYEAKAQTIDRFIENDYLFFGSDTNKLEKEIYDIKS